MPSVLIAGATGELGSAVTRQLAADGWTVGVGYRGSEDKATQLVEELRASGAEAWSVQADLSDPEEAAEAITQGPEPLSGVVYAAGPKLPLKYLSKIDLGEFSRIIDNDLKACANLMLSAIPVLRENGGAMLALTTMAASRWAKRDGLSAIPKAGVEALVKGIAVEEGRYGIRCNAVEVGPIDSGGGLFQDMIDEGHYNEEIIEILRQQIPMRRFGGTDDIAHAASFLMSPKAGYISGQMLAVDGAYTV